MNRCLVVAIAACLTLGVVASASATTFDPEKIVSNDNMRDYDAMTAKEIQAFLEAQSGGLAHLVTADYDKVITLSKTKSNVNTTPDKGEKPKPASQIIYEACRAWGISPKVMLVMLQKEQSLLTTKPKTGSTTLARAIGAGCPGSLVDPAHNKVATNRYPGFGNQIWYGARLLDGYGERKNGSTIPLFYLGIVRQDIYRHVTLHPRDLATYKLYVYNPSIGAAAPYGDLSTQHPTGNANFWVIYRKHFGDTYTSSRMRRVFRFRNKQNGTYLYTTSVTTRYDLSTNHSGSWTYGGSPFSIDTSVPSGATVPFYRFLNKKTHKYSYTRSDATYHDRRSTAGRRTWAYDGVTFNTAWGNASGSAVVYRMNNKRTGGELYTTSKSEVARLRTASERKVWAYKGIAFYLPRIVAR